MKGVQCYELFGGIALKNHAFSFIQELGFNTRFASELIICKIQYAPQSGRPSS